MPNVGDLIEIFRPGYQHWAIYVGDGYIIHLAPPSEMAYAGSNSVMSVFSETACVKKEKLSYVVGKDNYRVNNLLDHKYRPRDVSVILKQAHSFVGQTVTYSLINSNCEHFVTDLRYGQPTSRQVRQAAFAGAVAVAGLIALGGLGGLFSGSTKEKRNNY